MSKVNNSFLMNVDRIKMIDFGLMTRIDMFGGCGVEGTSKVCYGCYEAAGHGPFRRRQTADGSPDHGSRR